MKEEGCFIEQLRRGDDDDDADEEWSPSSVVQKKREKKNLNSDWRWKKAAVATTFSPTVFEGTTLMSSSFSIVVMSQ